MGVNDDDPIDSLLFPLVVESLDVDRGEFVYVEGKRWMGVSEGRDGWECVMGVRE